MESQRIQKLCAEGVIDLQIRNCSARIEVLQNQFDARHNLERVRALLYADHPEGAALRYEGLYQRFGVNWA